MLKQINIIELVKGDPRLPKLDYHYTTSGYYDLSIQGTSPNWKIELVLKPLASPLEKSSTEVLFEEHINEPRVFAALMNDSQVGWIELGYERWNNRMFVWEFLVKEEFRRMGIGSMLMRHAVEVASKRGARMLFLETQSCNVPAINFYLKHGFDLIGFDTAAYSNKDIEKKEVRLEFGLPLEKQSSV